MRTEVLLAGGDLEVLLSLAMELGPASVNSTIVESRQPVSTLILRPSGNSEVGIVLLTGSENVAELYELFSRHPRTRFVLLAPVFPPDAALARVATKHGSMFLSCRESSVVIAATVFALLAQTGTLS